MNIPGFGAFAFTVIFGLTVVSAAAVASEEKRHHRNHLSVFAGATHAEGSDEATIGLEYEYRLNERFGVGALLDHAGGDLDSTIVAGVVFFHPYEGLLLLAAAGNEHTHHGDELVLRAGIGYEFELGAGWTLTPLLNFDFVEHEETKEVYGVSIGRHF